MDNIETLKSIASASPNKNSEDDFLAYRRKVVTEYPSLRDQFAMACMDALIDRFYIKEGAPGVAIRAYTIADTIMKAKALTAKMNEENGEDRK